ncbi:MULTISPECIES: hypothetical protein [Pseudomonas]|uniref:hypothetical protein n=1 Tax=Pseudomonas TaxID=286 RepID=UPI00256E9DBD|nr:hypothetical protein [Pseudomonas sp. 29]
MNNLQSTENKHDKFHSTWRGPRKTTFKVFFQDRHASSFAKETLNVTPFVRASNLTRLFYETRNDRSGGLFSHGNNELALKPKPSILNKSIDLHHALLHSLHHSGFLPNATKGRTLVPERPAYHCATATPLSDLGWHVSTEAFFHCRGMQ